jgi:Reverse transcriptase (RNA-dependent DNA polymerase)
VRWNSVYSSEYKVLAGVRQGGILSPILFNVHVDNLIEEFKSSSHGCFIGRIFVGCIMYADDLLLLSPSINGMQSMLDICSVYSGFHDIAFNAAKTVIMSVGRNIVHKPLMFITKHEIAWVNQCKYLGVPFLARSNLVIDVLPIKQKFYGALNSIFSGNSSLAEPVECGHKMDY